MAHDVLFQPLQFRSLTVKNRLLRSNVSGRFDNYDGKLSRFDGDYAAMMREVMSVFEDLPNVH